ncbi:UbiA prenyltransferase [Lentithecium fluviatile CBS 122367]|uniref:4-hydroxybenzoate polyprenyltransferase, mitochondrial n=1 Tax=Lentithecium fluviatile CBS 122367 TaxID=1168545 RepID=A0A6G1IF08_9PLEO|nr:UbiA prenyltransferase [Lentithecium fluviatile CBS 122367]
MSKFNGSASSTSTSELHKHVDVSNEPPYRPPKSGVLAHVPASWVPYGELMRIEKPTGIYLFYFPHLFGTLYAVAANASGVPSYYEYLLWTNAKLFAGTVFMRAAACAWNDNLDREYDRQVRRCRLRPLARRALTPFQGYIFAAAMTIVAAAFLLALPTLCHLIAIPSIALLIIYPFTKRFTDFPQLILGFQVAIGILLGIAAVDPEALSNGNYSKEAVASFYLMNVAWTLVYDTVYAQQDVEDDAKAGVRSMAVRFRNGPRLLLTVVVVVQIALLSMTGKLQNFGTGYFGVACGGTFLSMVWMLLTIDLRKQAQCMWWFKNGCWLVGLSISGGLAVEAIW